jgi:putative oxidoreductase
MEGCLQRLFSTFADGWPGFGLLVQRLVMGICLLHNGLSPFKQMPAPAGQVTQVVAAVLAIFMMIGLWTPVAGVLLAALEVWGAIGYGGDREAAILFATFGATLAMIGPGAFSIDARLFGRKHFGN